MSKRNSNQQTSNEQAPENTEATPEEPQVTENPEATAPEQPVAENPIPQAENSEGEQPNEAPAEDEGPSKAEQRKARIEELVAKGMSRQAARKAEHARTVHDSPGILDVCDGQALTIEEIAEQTGHELTPSLKRRVGWLTDKDGVMVRSVEGSGKNKVTRYQVVGTESV